MNIQAISQLYSELNMNSDSHGCWVRSAGVWIAFSLYLLYRLTQTDAKRIAFKLTGVLKSILNIYLFYCAAVAVHFEDETK